MSGRCFRSARLGQPGCSPGHDPVCGMAVGDDSPYRHKHAGVSYRFCCAGCRDRFAAAPRWSGALLLHVVTDDRVGGWVID